jgi:hypothetical protein
MLRKYKDGETQGIRDQMGMRVSATLGRFVRDHEHCISASGTGFDIVTTVPSAKRPHPHPLEVAALRVADLRARFIRTMSPGPKPADHLTGSDQAFAVDAVEAVAGATILLLDDTFKGGAALQSAASALWLAGAADVAAVVIGRFFRPQYSDYTRAFWAEVRSRPFTFARCCLETDPSWQWPPPPPPPSSPPAPPPPTASSPSEWD